MIISLKCWIFLSVACHQKNCSRNSQVWYELIRQQYSLWRQVHFNQICGKIIVKWSEIVMGLLGALGHQESHRVYTNRRHFFSIPLNLRLGHLPIKMPFFLFHYVFPGVLPSLCLLPFSQLGFSITLYNKQVLSISIFLPWYLKCITLCLFSVCCFFLCFICGSLRCVGCCCFHKWVTSWTS